MSYTKQVSLNKENSKIKTYYDVSETAFKRRYANHKKHSITSNSKLIQDYQTKIGITYQQANLRTYPGKFWELINHTTKVLNDGFYASMKS